jgi:hypothetical protein
MRARFIKPMTMDSVKTVLIGLFILIYTDKKILLNSKNEESKLENDNAHWYWFCISYDSSPFHQPL